MAFTKLEPNCSQCLAGQLGICNLPTLYATAVIKQAERTLGFDVLTSEGVLALLDKLINDDRAGGKEPPLLNEVYNRFHEMYEEQHNPLEVAKG
jgi:hypothetical protein